MSRVDSHQAIENVLRNPAIWRAGLSSQDLHQSIATTHAELDRALPERGWPLGALTELLVKTTGTGELSLLAPALRAVCEEGRGIALLAPPQLPHARAWQQLGIPLQQLLIVEAEGRDLLWSAEQVLRSGECGAVVLWGHAAGRALNQRALQRLHLAAGSGRALCFVYRPLNAQTEASPAPLRLRLAAQDNVLRIHIAKCRGATRATPIPLQLFPAHWQVNGQMNAQMNAQMNGEVNSQVNRKSDFPEMHKEVLRVATEPSRHFIRVSTTAPTTAPTTA